VTVAHQDSPEDASAFARAASNVASTGRAASGPDTKLTPQLTYGHDQDKEKAAGEAHLRAANSHKRAASKANKAGDASAAVHHEQHAAAHMNCATDHAKNAGSVWDHEKHPLNDAGKLDARDLQRDVERFDLSVGTMGERQRTPQGGLVVPSNLTRTGVFEYRMPDGSRRRELRHPDDVFHPDSLATYPIAPVTVDHPGRVGPHNWKTHAVGTIGPGVRRNGDFVSGDVHLQHGDAMDRAERGDLKEISCGYTCDIDPTPGQYQGKPFDVAQKNIRINHVAIGPSGWGRMGPETRMHLDSAAAISGELDGASGDARYLRDDSGNRPRSGESKTMTPEEKAAQEKADSDALAAKLNADLTKAQREVEQARADAKAASTSGEKLAAQAREDQAKIATLSAENELLKHQVERSRSDGKTAEQKRAADAEEQRKVEELITLRADARMVFATVDDPEGKSWKADGKNADAIRREIILHLEPSLKLDGVEVISDSLYTVAISHERRAHKARADALAVANAPRRQDGEDEPGEGDDDDAPDAAAARKGMIKRKKDAWKMPKKDRAKMAGASK
jgi:uncharacterized protein